MLTSSEDASVRLWDLTSNELLNPSNSLRGGNQFYTTVAMSPKGRWLATGRIDETNLWDLESSDPRVRPVTLSNSTLSRRDPYDVAVMKLLQFSPDGRWLATAGRFGIAVRIWDLHADDPAASPSLLAPQQNLQSNRRPCSAIAFSTDGRWLATAQADKTIRIWPLTDDGPEATSTSIHGLKGFATTIWFSPDCRWLIAGNDSAVHIWDLTAKGPSVSWRL